MADVNINLNFIIKKFERKLSEATTKINTFSKRTDRQLNNLNSKLTRSFSRLGGVITTALGTGLGVIGARALSAFTSTLSEAVRESFRFETALREIETILPNNTKLTADNVEQLRALSSQYGSGPQQQAKAFYQIVSSGVTDTTQATLLLNAANKLAVGGLADLNGAIDILTTAVNTYGAENLTAAEAADSLFTAVRLGKTTAPALAASLGQVLPAARSLGVELDEVNAAVAVLTTRGFSTAEAVTRLNSLFTALARKSALLGPGFDAAAVKSDGFVKVLERLQERTGGSQKELIKLFGRVEAVQGFNVITQDLQVFNNTLDQFQLKAGAAQKATDTIINESTAKQVEILRNNLNLLAQDLVSVFNPAILQTTKLLNSLIGSDSAAQAKDLKEEIQDLQTAANLLRFSGAPAGFLGVGAIENRIQRLRSQLQQISQSEFAQSGGRTLVEAFDAGNENVENLNNSLELLEVNLGNVQQGYSLLRENFVEEIPSPTGDNAQAEIQAQQRLAIQEKLDKQLADLRAKFRQDELTAELNFVNSNNTLNERALAEFRRIEQQKIEIKRKTDQERINSITNTSAREIEQARFDADNQVALEKIVLQRRKEILADIARERQNQRRREAQEEQKRLQRVTDLEANIGQIEEEQAIAREQAKLERQLIEEENDQVRRDEILEQLTGFELAKIQIAAQAELDKAALIKDARERELTERRIQADTELKIEELKNKKLSDSRRRDRIDAEKRDREEQALLQGKLTATSNFLRAGSQLAKRGSAEQKALATAEAIVNTYAAANRALRESPTAIAPAVAASIVALGLANVARINSAGSFQDGGIIPGASVAGDRLTANVNSGEMILNRNQQAELFNQANGGGGRVDAQEMDRIVGAISNMEITLVANDNELARSVSRGVANGIVIGESE